MEHTKDSIQQHHSHKHSHHRSRRHKHRRTRYSTERQSHNKREMTFVLMCTAIVIVAMIILIPLLTNFFESF